MPADKTPTVRRKLVVAREERNLTQQQVADQLGVTKLTVGRWERGEAAPHRYLRRKLCALFSLSEQDLFLEENVPAEKRQLSSFLLDPTIPSLPHFIGRTGELAHMKRLLCAGSNVVLTATVNGIPGVGKTALSIAIAQDPDVQAAFPDGVLWAGLGPHANIPGLLNHWGTLLGLSAPEATDAHEKNAWARTIRNAIGSRSLLLVIDDAWSIADATALKIGGPNCAYLLTTRFPEVANFMAFENAMTLDELSEEESLELLRFLAPVIVEQERQSVQHLIRAVGGLPLALTLIGNYLRHHSYGRQTRRISSALERLNHVETRLHMAELLSPVESHTSLSSNTVSLAEIIAVSDYHLDEAARAALYALSVLPAKPNSFSEEAALAVAACEVETLDELIDAGLVSPILGDRLQMHQTINDYASFQSEKCSASATAYQRLVVYAAGFVALQRDNHTLLEQESALILTALKQAMVLQMQGEFLQLLLSSFEYFRKIGMYAFMDLCLQYALQIAPQEKKTLALLYFYFGCVLRPQGKYEEAQAAFGTSFDMAKQEEDLNVMSKCLSEMGSMYMKVGAYQQSVHTLQEGLVLARQLGDRRLIGKLLKTLGGVYDYQGQFYQGAEVLQEALHLARELEDLELISSLSISIGANLGSTGEEERAEAVLLEGLALAKQVNLRESQCVCFVNLAELQCQRGTTQALEQADLYIREGMNIAEEIGSPEWQGILLLTLGTVKRKQEMYSEADSCLQKSLALGKELGNHRLTCGSLCELGDIALAQKRVADARKHFDTALQEGAWDKEMMALAHFGVARYCVANGDLNVARQHAEASLDLFQCMGHAWKEKVQDWLTHLQ